MQNYKYQLSAPSSSETLISAEPEVSWRGEKLSQRGKENKQNHVKECSNLPDCGHPGVTTCLWPLQMCTLARVGCVCVCVHDWRRWVGEQGIIRAEWWVVATSDDCRGELCQRTNTAFINARRPLQCRQHTPVKQLCFYVVCVCVVRGGRVEPPLVWAPLLTSCLCDPQDITIHM